LAAVRACPDVAERFLPSWRMSVAAAWPCVNRALAVLADRSIKIFPGTPYCRDPAGSGGKHLALPGLRPVDTGWRQPR
jgi:hypothetical protein